MTDLASSRMPSSPLLTWPGPVGNASTAMHKEIVSDTG